MPVDLIYFQLAFLVLSVNAIPAFMPPTWVILAFFFYHFHLNLAATVIIGALSAASGRILLSKLSKNYLSRILPKTLNQNYIFLGKFFKTNKNLSIPIMLTYAFFPIPSNQIFIALGLANVNVLFFAAAFFMGRLISYTLWISVSNLAVKELNSIFQNSFSHGLVIELIGFSLLLIIGLINWKSVLKVK